MGIVAEDIERVKTMVAIEDVVGQHVALKKVGRRYVGLCPFHAENTASFNVNAELGIYKCFGCDAGGDVISFVREIMHLDFVDAVEWLAGRAGVQLRYDDEKASTEHKRKARLLEAMEKAVAWYHERLLTAPDAGRARGYLRSRGYGPEVVRQFRIGWAPEEWDALARHLKVPDDVLRDTGLGMPNNRGGQRDTFRGRVLFPILDPAGRPIALGGRILPGGEGPKYRNSSETPLYSKSRTLYGLNWAKAGAVEAGEVVVCEGYTDVIGFFTAGVPRAVATCGTALTEEHVRLLKSYARRLVLAYDADSAGQSAAERFYAWEQAYDLDLRVATFPPGSDPGDLARTDPEALAATVAGAKPFLAFRLERVLRGADLRSPEGRARAAGAAIDVVREHPNELVRDQYVMEVADRCRMEPDRLREMLRAPRRMAADDAAPERTRPTVGGTSAATMPRAELEAIRLALHNREELRDLLSCGGDDLARIVAVAGPLLFTDDLALAAFAAVVAHPDVAQAGEAAGPEAAELLLRLGVEESDASADDVLALLCAEAVGRLLVELQADTRSTPDRFAELAPVISWLVGIRKHLLDADARREAVTQLVPWLVQWGEVSR